MKCFRNYLESRNHESMLIVLAPTGKAAVGVGGHTVWNGLGYSTQGPPAAGNAPSEPFLLPHSAVAELPHNVQLPEETQEEQEQDGKDGSGVGNDNLPYEPFLENLPRLVVDGRADLGG